MLRAWFLYTPHYLNENRLFAQILCGQFKYTGWEYSDIASKKASEIESRWLFYLSAGMLSSAQLNSTA
jgi:hypothetical protein